jgi:proline racemase
MRAARYLSAVDSHTEGMPTRVITGGVATMPGATMLERKRWFEANADELRLLLMREPRGHGAMSGAILQPPTRPDADVGVLFIEVSGCLPMCGHGTIGVATVLVETGMVEVAEPVTTVRLDTPAGLIAVRVEVSGGRAVAATLRNVPAFVLRTGAEVEVPDLGRVLYDLAYGGNFYALLPAASVGVAPYPEQAPRLIEVGRQIMTAINAADRPVHPEDERISGCHHVVLHEPGTGGADARAATSIHPGWLDRSPCGTGTSARLAQLHAAGRLALGEPFVNESVIGTRFTGRVVQETTVGGYPAVIPEITGRAWITGTGQYLLDPDDPFPAGFAL